MVGGEGGADGGVFVRFSSFIFAWEAVEGKEER